MRRMNSGWRNRACVYLLQRLDRKRFKVGWARNPLVRIRAFPEFSAGLLDLKASRVLWLPNRPRAEQVERSLQKCLMPYGTPVGHIRDGHSE